MSKPPIILLLIILLSLFIRVYQLDKIPVALHGDELGVGYNAYSLLKEGVDEKGKPWPMTFRHDIGPIIFYATIPSVALFGLSELATRLPSAAVGTSFVLLYFFIISELARAFLSSAPFKISPKKVALLGSLLLSVSPWHVEISRITHDGSYSLLFQGVALLFLLKFLSLKKKNYFLLFSCVLGFSFYSYHAPRLTSPLIFICLTYMKRKIISRRLFFWGLFLLIFIASPLLVDFFSKPFSQTRAGGINIFIGQLNSPIDILSIPSLFAKNIPHQLNLTQLFINSSNTRYFNIRHVGLFYIWYMLFLLIATLQYKNNSKMLIIFGLMIAIAILPGALTSGPMNAGRIILLLPIIEFITLVGIVTFLSQKNIADYIKTSMLMIFVFFSTLFFLYQYFVDAPRHFSASWQHGVKEAIQYLLSKEAEVDQIVISDTIKQAYIYVLFYGDLSIDDITQSSNLKLISPVGYNSIGKFRFNTNIAESNNDNNSTLLLSRTDDKPKGEPVAVFPNKQHPLYIVTKE